MSLQIICRMKAKTKTTIPPRQPVKTRRWWWPVTIALLAGLGGVIILLLSAKTQTSSREPDREKIATGSAGGTGLTGNPIGSDDQASVKSNESSTTGDSSGDFSGIKSTLDPALASAIPTPNSTPEPQQEPSIPLPLVFQSIDPQRLSVTPDQQKVITRLKQKFLDMIGGADQDPSDPQYLQRWQQAQPSINEELELQLGQEFFQEYETAATQIQLAKEGGARSQ